jgi:excisionase family DNA binding protein
MTDDNTPRRNTRTDPGLDQSRFKAAGGHGGSVSLDEPLLTADAVAQLLALAPSSVYYLKDNGDLPYVLVGKRIRFSKLDIERYLAGCRRGPRAEL